MHCGDCPGISSGISGISTNTYDIARRPTSLSGSANNTTTPYVQGVGYWPHGAVNYWQYGNNVWPVEIYSKLLQPAAQFSTVGNNANSYLLYLGDAWNKNGTLYDTNEGYGPSVPSNSLTWYGQGMGYDNLNRLTSIVDSNNGVINYSRSFQFDEYGNASVTASPGVPLSGLTPNLTSNLFKPANNQLYEASYDTRGNVRQLGAVQMAYDGESRQIQTTDSGTGQTITYLYDGEGQRVQRQVAGGATTVYVHDAFGQLAAEYDSAGVPPSCVTCYLSYDLLGSVRLVTNESAGVVARHDYLPFGEEIPNGYAGRTGNGFGAGANVAQLFTGQERDGGTAMLDYFNARHMSAVLGSFTQPDPDNAGGDVMHPQSWNAYAYVLGNPLGLVDPSGMFALSGNNPCGPGRTWTGEGCSGEASGGIPFMTIFESSFQIQPGSIGGGGGGGRTYDNSDVFKGNFFFASLVSPSPQHKEEKSCEEQLAEIDRKVNSVRNRPSDYKGLAQRYRQLPNLPSSVLLGHVKAFFSYQSNLRRLIQSYKDSGCGDPPDDLGMWTDQPLQPIVKQKLTGSQRVAIGAGTVGVGAAGWLAGDSIAEWLLGLTLAALP